MQVTIWKILHGYEYAIVIVVPTERLDKALLVLDKV